MADDCDYDPPAKRERSRSPLDGSKSPDEREWKKSERLVDGTGDRNDTATRNGHSEKVDNTKVRLYVSNINYAMSWQDLKDSFRDKVGKVITYVELYTTPEGNPCGAGVVEVQGVENAKKAIDIMHKQDMRGRKIIVREEREKDRMLHNRPIPGDRGILGPGSAGGPRGGNMMQRGGPMGRGMVPGVGLAGGLFRNNMGQMGGAMGNMGGSIGNMGGGIGNMGGSIGNMGGGMGNMGGGMGNTGGGMGNMVDGMSNMGGGMGNMGGGMGNMGGGMGNMGGGVGNMGGGMGNTGGGMGGSVGNMGGGMGILGSGMGNLSGGMGNMGGLSGGVGMGNLNNMGGIGMGNMGGTGNMGVGGGIGSLAGGGGNIGGGRSMAGGGGMDSVSDPRAGSMPVNHKLLQQMGLDPASITDQVFLANLDYSVTDMKLREVFQLAGNAVEVAVRYDSDGKSLGRAIVRFEHPMEAVQAISMFNGQMLYDRVMSVRMDKKAMENTNKGTNKLPDGLKGIGLGLGAGGMPVHNFQGLSSGSMGGGMGAMRNVASGTMPLNMGGGGNTMNSMNSNMMSLGGSPGGMMQQQQNQRGNFSMEPDCIVLRNLPFTFTWQNLRDKFQSFGDVRFAEIKMENGRSKGVGVVRFASPELAKRAVALANGIRIEGRVVQVCLQH